MTIPYTRQFAYFSHLYSAHSKQLTLSGHVWWTYAKADALTDLRYKGTGLGHTRYNISSS